MPKRRSLSLALSLSFFTSLSMWGAFIYKTQCVKILLWPQHTRTHPATYTRTHTQRPLVYVNVNYSRDLRASMKCSSSRWWRCCTPAAHIKNQLHATHTKSSSQQHRQHHPTCLRLSHLSYLLKRFARDRRTDGQLGRSLWRSAGQTDSCWPLICGSTCSRNSIWALFLAVPNWP